MDILVVLLILLALGFFGGLPGLGLHHYGYGPSGVLGLVLVILLIVYLVRRL